MIHRPRGRAVAHVAHVALVSLALACCSDDATDDDESAQVDPVQCGSGTCAGREVCIIRPQSADCENKQNEDDPCPADKPNDMRCGGAGLPCCCGNTPPSLYECDPAVLCGDDVTCACLTDACPESKHCMPRVEPGTFTCEDYLPA